MTCAAEYLFSLHWPSAIIGAVVVLAVAYLLHDLGDAP